MKKACAVAGCDKKKSRMKTEDAVILQRADKTWDNIAGLDIFHVLIRRV